MSQRERTLAFLVGGAVAVLINIFLIKFFLDKYHQTQDDRAKVEGELAGYRMKEARRETSAKRDVWLTAHLTTMGDPDVANKRQREAMLDLAKKHEVIISNITNGSPHREPEYTAMAQRVECKGGWDKMRDFLFELQGPENFIAVESMELKVDPNDKTQLSASLTVAHWYSPKS